MSNKIAKVEREITRVNAPSLDEVLGKPTAIVKRGVRSNKRPGRIIPGKHTALLHTIRCLKDRRGYMLVAFEMTVLKSESMIVGEEMFYVHTIRPDGIMDTSTLAQHLKNLELTPNVLMMNKESAINIAIDVECVPTTSMKGRSYNVISMWKKK